MLGDTWGLVAAAGVAWWLFGRRHAHAVIAAAAISTVLWISLNAALDVPRPDPAAGIDVYDELDIGSFPSGHVQQATAAWGTLYARGALPLSVVGAIVLVVAVARVYLGAHYVADVAVAIPLGLLVALLVGRYWEGVRRRFAETGWFWPAIWGASLLAAIAIPLAGLGDEARRWESAGLVLGAVIALPAERKWIRYQPPHRSLLRNLLCAAAGAAAVAALLITETLIGERGGMTGGALIALAVIWAWAAFPALLSRVEEPAR